MASPVARRLLTVEEYYLMAEVGILQGQNLELIKHYCVE